MSQESPTCFQRLDRSQRFPYRPSEYLRRFAWLVVQGTLFRFSPPRANGWRRMLLRCFGARIGDCASVRRTARVVHPWLFSLGDRSVIGEGVTIYNLGSVSIGAHSVVSHDAYLCAGTHDYTVPHLPLLRPPIEIGNGVWVATAAFLGPGCRIGDNSVIGARAVVTGEIPPNVVAAGNPCRVIKPREMKDVPADLSLR